MKATRDKNLQETPGPKDILNQGQGFFGPGADLVEFPT